MRVMCIDDDWSDKTILFNPVFGKIYTVVDEVVEENMVFYELKEFLDFLYEIDAFVPVSEIDEMELVNKKEAVC